MKQAEHADGDYHGRAVVPGPCVRLSAEAARVAVPSTGGTPSPQVELVRDGDTIRAIDITCSCGQRIRLHCVYDG